MYYVEAVVKIRIEDKQAAYEPYWLKEAIETYLEGEEEVLSIRMCAYAPHRREIELLETGR